MTTLPKDIIKEIVDKFDARTPAGIYNLQKLRLVNSAFSSFATWTLFRRYETFRLGDSYENMESRLHTLSISPLRHRVQNLDIPRTILIPRAFQRGDFTEYKQRQLHQVLDGVVASCRVQFGRLQDILGPTFRFKEVYLTEGDDAFLSEHDLDGVMNKFMDLLSEVLSEPMFGQVACLDGTFYAGDINRLLTGRNGRTRYGPDLMPEISMAQANVSRFLANANKLETLTISFASTGWRRRPLLGPDWIALGCIIELSRSVKALVLQFEISNRFLPWNNKLDRIEQLFLNRLRIDDLTEFQDALENLPGLFVLGLIECTLEDHRWVEILTYLLQSKHNLITVRLEGLHYLGELFTPRDEFIVNDNGTPRRCKRPLLTRFQSDIDGARRLINTVRARRGGHAQMFPQPAYLEELYSLNQVWQTMKPGYTSSMA